MNSIAMKNNTGRNFLIGLLSFFVVVSIVDGIFVYNAIKSFSGEVVDHAYEKGLAYNSVIEHAERQSKSGISGDLSFERGVLTLSLKNKDGVPVTTARASVKFIRPVFDGQDFEADLVHAGHGVYRAEADLPADGVWIAKAEAAWDTQVYRKALKFMNR